MKSISRIIPLVILLLIVVYINGPNCSYYFLGRDDIAWIENSAYNPETGIQWALSGQHFIGYRPATALTFTLDYALWKWNPFGYHLTNVLLHIVCIWILYWFALLLFDNLSRPSLAAFTSAFIFAIHPSSYDVVPFISRRADIITGIFMLLSMGIILKALRGNISTYRTSAMIFLFVLTGCLFKETSMLIPAFIIFAGVLCLENKKWKYIIKKTLLFFSVSVAGVIAYSLIRQYVGRTYFNIAFKPRHLSSLITLLCNHFGNLFFPGFWQVDNWAGIVITSLLLGVPLLVMVAGVFILSFQERSFRLKILMLMGILVTLALPYWDTINWVRRYLYQGAAFFSLLLTTLLFLPRQKEVFQKYVAIIVRTATLLILFFIISVSPLTREYTYLNFASNTARAFIEPLLSYVGNSDDNQMYIAAINAPFSGYALAPYEKTIMADEPGWGKYGRRNDGPVHHFNIPLFFKTTGIKNIPDFITVNTLRYRENSKIKAEPVSFKNGEVVVRIISGKADCRSEHYTLSKDVSAIDCEEKEGNCFRIKWDRTKIPHNIVWYYFDGVRGKIITPSPDNLQG